MRPIKSRPRRKGTGSAITVKVIGWTKAGLALSLPYILLLALVGVLLGAVMAYAMNSPTFRLDDVRILNVGSLTKEQSFAFCELRRGENLISLDLVNVQEVIKRKHPEFKEVRVRRVLPNRVEVIVRRRTPVAQVMFSRYVQIDKDLVVLPGSGTQPFKNLTVIEGARPPRQGLAVGAIITDPDAKKAVKLSDVIKRSNVLKNHALTKIDIRDPKNISFYADGDLEIRIGNSHFIERLKILDQTIRTIGLDKSKVRYIDLRFDDVVIGPK